MTWDVEVEHDTDCAEEADRDGVDRVVAVAGAATIEPESPGIDCELAQSTNASALAVVEPGRAAHEVAEPDPLASVPVVSHVINPSLLLFSRIFF